MPQDEPDINNFSTSSEHKLPAISGAQALQDELRRARGIPTSLPSLDQSLGLPGLPYNSNGVRRGCVTEVFGPPGSGKSTFGMQVAVNAIRSLDTDSQVLWLSTSSPLMRSRLVEIAKASTTSESQDVPSSPPQAPVGTRELESHFVYKEITSLPHLLVMLMHPTALFPPRNTTVLIIDGLANFLLGTLPRGTRSEDAKSTSIQENSAKRANSKRFQLVDNLASALSRLAASRHIAILVLMNATTSMKSGQRAVLKPALSRPGWDAAINTRITLYRDLYPQQYRAKLTMTEKRGYRLAEVTRWNFKDVIRDPVPFVIEGRGLRELDIYQQPPESARPGVVPTPEISVDMGAVPLEIRTSQASPDHRNSAAFPTASQVLRQEYAVIDSDVEALQPREYEQRADEALIPAAPGPGHETEARAAKRKAIEIADSEDEDDGDVLPEPTLPPPVTGTPVLAPAALPSGPEDLDTEQDEMLFDSHERRR